MFLGPDKPVQAYVLGCRVDVVDMAHAVERVAALVEERHFAHVVTFGSEMAMLARRDSRYREVVNSADLVVPDSVGVVYAARVAGYRQCVRVAGVELVEVLTRLCAERGWPVYLLGGREGVATGAGEALRKRHPGLVVAGTHHGYFTPREEDDVARHVGLSGARLVFVGLGFPRQELWIRDHAASLGSAVCMGVGGTFDVLSGRLPRAPAGWRRHNLEWLYRLLREPRRLRRQLALPGFAILAVWDALRRRQAAGAATVGACCSSRTTR